MIWIMDQVTELASFLKDPRPEVSETGCDRRRFNGVLGSRPTIVSDVLGVGQARLMAAEGIQGLTGSPDGVQILAGHAAALLPALFLRVPDQTDISKAALTALVNLSQVLLFGHLAGLLSE